MGIPELMVMVSTEAPADFLVFLGRIHPLIVHFPIAFLLLAAVCEFLIHKTTFKGLKNYIKYIWGLGALSALMAAVLGYFLSLSGDYDENTVFWHKWTGIALLIFALFFYYISKKEIKLPLYGRPIGNLLIIGMVFYTGHLGGNLTHGSTYLLEFAPNPIRNMAGLSDKVIPRKKVSIIDSADVYLDLISPMLQNRCASCHNADKKKGDFDLTTYSKLLKGGENGEVITPGDTETSDLFRRITIAPSHEDFMPTDGKRPLTDKEVTMIEWWISNRALSKGYFMSMNPDDRIIGMAKTYLGLDDDPLNREVMEPKQSLLDTLRKQGFILNQLIKDQHFYEANFSLSEIPINEISVSSLIQLNEQLIWLNMSNRNITDENLMQIGQLSHLIKLNLSKNDITDKGLRGLMNLSQLESLNLYETKVSNGLLTLIPTLKKLKRLYLSKSEVTIEIVETLRKENEKLTIVFD